MRPLEEGDRRDEQERVQVVDVDGVEYLNVHLVWGHPAPPLPRARGHASWSLQPHHRALHYAIAARNAHLGEAPNRH
jgi:hypothetical protein